MPCSLNDNGEIKEEFCGACMALPVAIAGAGAAGYGSKKGTDSHKKTKKIMLWSGIALTILSIIIAIVYMRTCKECR
jgi:hypothetical protein